MHIKKVTKKDRYGNQTSVEYEAPEKPFDVNKMFSDMLNSDSGVPEMAPPPVMGEEFNMGDPMTHPGGPMGEDTVPAWLTPGEFVVNAEATEMFGPEIEAMNDVGRMMQGGEVVKHGGGVPPHMLNMGGKIGGYLNDIAIDAAVKSPDPDRAARGMSMWPDTAQTIADWGMALLPFLGMQQGGRVDELNALSESMGWGRPLRQGTPQEVAAERARVLREAAMRSEDAKREAFRWADPSTWGFNEGGAIPMPQSPEETLLKAREGYSDQVYTDTTGNPTVGYGHKVPGAQVGSTPYTPEQNQANLLENMATAKQAAIDNVGLDTWNHLNKQQRAALTSMAFQLGGSGMGEFDQMLGALQEGDAAGVRREAMDSKWAEQTPARVDDLTAAFPDGSIDDGKPWWQFWNQGGQIPFIAAPLMYPPQYRQEGGMMTIDDYIAKGGALPSGQSVSHYKRYGPTPNTIAWMDTLIQGRPDKTGELIEPDLGLDIPAPDSVPVLQDPAIQQQIAQAENMVEGGDGDDLGTAPTAIPNNFDLSMEDDLVETQGGLADENVPTWDENLAGINWGLTPERQAILDEEAAEREFMASLGNPDPEAGYTGLGDVGVAGVPPIEGVGDDALGKVPLPDDYLMGGEGDDLVEGTGVSADDTLDTSGMSKAEAARAEARDHYGWDDDIELDSKGRPTKVNQHRIKSPEELDELKQKYLDGKITKKQYENQLSAHETAVKQDAAYNEWAADQETETAAAENDEKLTELEERKKRAEEIGDEEAVAEIQGEIDALQGGETTTGQTSAGEQKTSSGATVNVVADNANTSGSNTPADDGVNDNDVVTTGEQGTDEQKGKVTSMMEGLFGDLFDPAELQRAAIMYLGSRLMGYDHGASLQYSLKNYVGRVDAKTAAASKQAATNQQQAATLASTGKYTPESLAEFQRTGDVSKLKPAATAAKPVKITGTKVMVPGQGLVQVWEQGGVQGYHNAQGALVPLAGSGARIYDAATMGEKAVKEEFGNWTSNELGKINQGIEQGDDAYVAVNNTRVASDANMMFQKLIRDSRLPNNDAEYVKNNIGLAINDFVAAKKAWKESGEGNEPMSVTPFIEARMMSAITGVSPAMLNGVSMETQYSINKRIMNEAKRDNPEATDAQINRQYSQTWQQAQGYWATLDPEDQEKYQKLAVSGQNGFTVFLSKLVNDDPDTLKLVGVET